MTVEAMSGLSAQAGGAVAAATGRAVVWAIGAYMRAPLRNTAIAALLGVSALAGANALYHQAHRHPAPLFGSFATTPSKPTVKPLPVVPAPRPKGMSQAVSPETTGSVDPTTSTKVISTDDVAALQTQLKAMELFDGKVDGLFGGKTARAIKAFETRLGRAPRGLLTPQIIALAKAQTIMALPGTPAPAAAEQAVQVASADPAPKSDIAPMALAAPLPAPAPLVSSSKPVQVAAVDPQQITPVADPTAIVAPEDDASSDSLGATTVAPLAATAPAAEPSIAVAKRVVQTVAVHVTQTPSAEDGGEMPPSLTANADVPPATDDGQVATDKPTVAAVQRGLNSLGFLHGEISGVADEATAKAIRNFEVYFNYAVTGRITRALVRVLQASGADVEG
jgi:peptidoglycan hydrolase-like protein with peptidoglycan-binding domain